MTEEQRRIYATAVSGLIEGRTGRKASIDLVRRHVTDEMAKNDDIFEVADRVATAVFGVSIRETTGTT